MPTFDNYDAVYKGSSRLDLAYVGNKSIPLPLKKYGNFQSYSKSPYSAYTGMWGIYVAGNDTLQATSNIRVFPAVFPAKTVIDWNVVPDPDYAGINGYLHIDYGNYSDSPSTITPRQVYTITNLSLAVDWTFTGDAATGLLAECWLTATSHASGGWSDSLFEIGFLPKVSPSAQTWANGLSSVGTGSFVDGNGITWVVKNAGGSTPYIVAYRSGYADHVGALPYSDYFAFLISSGVITGNEWFNGLAFGPEPFSGAGSVMVNSFVPTYTGAARVPWTITNLTASTQSDTTIQLSWRAAAGATSHQYRINGGTWTNTGTANSQTVTGLTANTAYAFEVRGVNTTGNGNSSNVANASTAKLPYTIPSTNLLRRWRADSIAQSNNTAVASWPALNGGVDLTQATAASQPTYVTNRINGKPAVTWGSAVNSKYLSATGFATQSQPLTFVAVCKPADISSTIQVLAYSASGGNVEMFIETGKWGSWANGALYSAGAPSVNVWVVFTFVLNGGTSALYINGTQVAAGNGGNATAGDTLNIGRHPTNGRNWRGDMGEIITYTGAADATTRAQIHSYAQDYWGITVADYLG